MVFAFYIVLGLGAGFLSGLLGVGGGVIIVPALLWLFHYQALPLARLISLAAGTSCAIMVITTSRSLFARKHHFPAAASVYKKLVVSIILGALIGSMVSHYIHPVALQIIFAMLMLILACSLLLPNKFNLLSLYTMKSYHISGVFIGCLSSMLGIGGSSLTVPFLFNRGECLRSSTLVALALSASLAPVAAIVYMIMGWSKVTLPWCTGYVYWPAVLCVGLGAVIAAPAGVRYAQKIPTALLRKYFAVLMVIIAMHLIISV